MESEIIQPDPGATYIYNAPRARPMGPASRFLDIPTGALARNVRKKSTGGFYFSLDGFEGTFYCLSGENFVLNTEKNQELLREYKRLYNERSLIDITLRSITAKLATLRDAPKNMAELRKIIGDDK